MIDWARLFDKEELKKKRLLTREEAAFYLGIGVTTIRRYLKMDDFPVIRIGKQRLFIEREKLNAWYQKYQNSKK